MLGLVVVVIIIIITISIIALYFPLVYLPLCVACMPEVSEYGC